MICCYCWSCETISNWSNNQLCMCKLGLKVPMIKLHSFSVRGDLSDLFLFCVRHECVEIGMEPTTKSVKVKRLFNRACCSSVEVGTYIISIAIILRIYNLCYILLSFLSMTLPRWSPLGPPSPSVFPLRNHDGICLWVQQLQFQYYSRLHTHKSNQHIPWVWRAMGSCEDMLRMCRF